MFNARLYLPRYLPAIQIAAEIYPRIHKIENGLWSPVTNVSRIRETRKHIFANTTKFSEIFTEAELKNLNALSVWCDDNHTYLGNPKVESEVNPMTSSLTNVVAGDIRTDITTKDIQAICYVLERSLVTLPVRLHTQDEGIRADVTSIVSRCPNVEFSQTHDTITLF